VFFLITIPMIAPSLAAGGMMSFALSLDDLVLASFVSGPAPPPCRWKCSRRCAWG
jgi:putrescine transport system permease protein